MLDGQAATNSICAVCGGSFVCGVTAGQTTCWCMEKPRGLLIPDSHGGCYCLSCLDRQTSTAMNEFVPPA